MRICAYTYIKLSKRTHRNERNKMNATTRKEYEMAYRAMRRWWKLVDSNNSPAITQAERDMFKNIVDAYDTQELKAAMDSIRMRRTAEYYAEFPAAERAARRAAKNPAVVDGVPF